MTDSNLQQSEERRDWDWEKDGQLDGMYVETRLVHVRNSPSKGKVKAVFDFHVGLEDELVTAWSTSVLHRQFRTELQRRKADDFKPGERIVITPKGKRMGDNGLYWDFADTQFEFAAPKPTAASMLATVAGNEPDDESWRPLEPDVPIEPPEPACDESESDGGDVPF